MTSEWKRFIPPAPHLRVSRESLPYHEAGHAVFLGAIGFPIAEAVVGETCGHVKMGAFSSVEHPDPRFSAEILNRLADLLSAGLSVAGAQAEYILAGLEPDGRVTREDKDHISARCILKAHCPDNMDFAELCVQKMAYSLLRANWPAVCEIAARLGREGSACNDDITRAVGELRPLSEYLDLIPPNILLSTTHFEMEAA